MDNALLNWLNDETEIDDDQLIENGFELFFKDLPKNEEYDEKTLQLLLI